MKRRALYTAAVIGGTLTGCAIMTVGTDFSPSTDFTPYHTYAWDTRDALPTGDPRLDANPFFDARVRTAVDSVLAARGYQLVAAEAAELTVHYHASVEQKVDVYSVDRERGYYPQETQVMEYEEGTLLIDVAESQAKRIIWRGWAQTDITGVIDRRDLMERRLRDAVVKILQRFPPNPGTRLVAPGE